jgi:predicted negative regulator of RcsB-dependent stress response
VNCCKRLGDKELMLTELAKLMDMKPAGHKTRLKGLIELADIYETKGNIAEAKKVYKEVLNSTSNKKWKKVIKLKLEEMNDAKPKKEATTEQSIEKKVETK